MTICTQHKKDFKYALLNEEGTATLCHACDMEGRISWLEQENAALKRDVKLLKVLTSEIADYELMYDKVINEKCPSDEKHCTCVPILRRENAALKAEVESVSAFWKAQVQQDSGIILNLRAKLERAEAILRKYADPNNWTDEMLEDSGAVVQVFKEEIECPCTACRMAQLYFEKLSKTQS